MSRGAQKKDELMVTDRYLDPVEITQGICVKHFHFQKMLDCQVELSGKKLDQRYWSMGEEQKIQSCSPLVNGRRKSPEGDVRGPVRELQSCPGGGSDPQAGRGASQQEDMLPLAAGLSERRKLNCCLNGHQGYENGGPEIQFTGSQRGSGILKSVICF